LSPDKAVTFAEDERTRIIKDIEALETRLVGAEKEIQDVKQDTVEKVCCCSADLVQLFPRNSPYGLETHFPQPLWCSLLPQHENYASVSEALAEQKEAQALEVKLAADMDYYESERLKFEINMLQQQMQALQFEVCDKSKHTPWPGWITSGGC
jgi:nitric oxide reductase activation protein